MQPRGGNGGGGSGGSSGSSGAGGDPNTVAGAGGEAGTPSTPEPGTVGDCGQFQATVGTTFYACECGPGAAVGCVGGSDQAIGSIDQPLSSYHALQLQFGSLAAGDSVAFCRGGSFSVKSTDDRRWLNDNCTAQAPCTIRDYVPPWADAGAPPPRLEIDGGVGFDFDTLGQDLSPRQLLNLSLHGNQGDQAVYASGKLNHLLLCGLELSGFKRGLVFNPYEPTQSVVLRDSDAHDLGGAAFTTGGGICSDCGVIHDSFERVGAPNEGAILLWSESDPNLRIEDNEFSNIGHDGAGHCAATAIDLHGKQTDASLARNRFTEAAASGSATCKAISLSADLTAPAERVRIANNLISNFGAELIHVRYCDDCLIENNVLVTEQPIASTLFYLGGANRTKLRNNTLYFSADAGSDAAASAGFLFERDATTELSNNLILNLGSRPQFSCFFGLDPSTPNFEYSDYNLCFFPHVVAGEWVSGRGRLLDWQQVAGAPDQHSFYADPELDAELHPNAGSFVAGKGDRAHAPATDAAGKARRDPPDVGAYEHD